MRKVVDPYRIDNPGREGLQHVPAGPSYRSGSARYIAKKRVQIAPPDRASVAARRTLSQSVHARRLSKPFRPTELMLAVDEATQSNL